ncbi:MAG: hypothetical protein R2788_09840 [Saprospiraceae bacterium]
MRFIFHDQANTFHAKIHNPAAFNPFDGQPVTMGIRLEHLHAALVKGAVHYAEFQADVQLIERLGYEFCLRYRRRPISGGSFVR